ncbi:hypothetical protein M2454_002098 [Aequitasia blattaphilus]
MNLFMQFFVQAVAMIIGIVVVFQLIGKIFLKDTDDDEE